jgi:hypothetical protein
VIKDVHAAPAPVAVTAVIVALIWRRLPTITAVVLLSDEGVDGVSQAFSGTLLRGAPQW